MFYYVIDQKKLQMLMGMPISHCISASWHNLAPFFLRMALWFKHVQLNHPIIRTGHSIEEMEPHLQDIWKGVDFKLYNF